ncbi:MAG: relaxase domain-containing protein [Rhodospirillaceae bacterium]|nr:relaxase domain-containing protein [Rhodospirillaceae bacterium]
MVASIGAIASAAQGVSYFERDGYYAKDDPEHREASAWTGRGADDLGLKGAVDPEAFRAVLEGEVPDGSGTRLGRRGRDGEIRHRPGRDVTLSAPKSVSLAALVGGDGRAVEAHDRAVAATLAWIEKNAAETRMKDPDTGSMVRAGGQKTVAAVFRHDTSRNLDPQLHSHAVLANMVKGEDGKWRTMANEKLYESKMLIGAVYRAELARGLGRLGYGVEKTHADGRFEIAGVPREVVEAFSSRRAEIEAAMAARDLGAPADNPRLAERAALMTRAAKRDIDREELRNVWRRQAEGLGFDARALAAGAAAKAVEAERAAPVPEAGRDPAAEAADWAVSHLSEREAVFSRTDLLTAALSWDPGKVTVVEAEAAVRRLEDAGTLHAARLPGMDGLLTTERAAADERETIALMAAGTGRGDRVMRARSVDKTLRKGPLTAGQKAAVRLILASEDRTVGVQGYAGSGKTTMLNRARALLEKRGYRVRGLAPSASAARTLEAEAGIGSETLQRFLARNAGVAAGRMTEKGAKEMRAAFAKTVLVVDEGSLASTVQARDLLRVADALRIPRVVLVGDEKQLDAVDAGKPFAQLQAAGMKTAVMDEIMRQRDPALKEAVEASLAGDIGRAFEKLGGNVAEVKPDNLAGAAAARWLALPPEQRQNTGLMAPSHALREGINEIVRERLVRDGAVHGPAVETERLVSRGFTNAEKALTRNYAVGDVVGFHRPYRRLGVDKGDELRVARVDRAAGAVLLAGKDGEPVAWEPGRLAARAGGVEVYRVEAMELRAGDRIRWTRNDAGLGLVNSQTAEVTAVRDGRIGFRLEDGRRLDMNAGDPQLRHIDRAWASTVHAFQGRTVDTVIAALEAKHPTLTNQKTLYVEISRARDRAELVTDDKAALQERIQALTGERIAALEAVPEARTVAAEPAAPAADIGLGSGDRSAARKARKGLETPSRDRDMPAPERGRGVDRDFGL